MVKICDLIEQAEASGKPFVSYEFFPPKTEKGVENLQARILDMQKRNPLFMDLTWGAGGSTADTTLDLVVDWKKKGLEPNMHLTCTNMDVSLVEKALETCKKEGIENIVALRGDPPAGEEAWTATEGGFNCALDLVKHMRKLYGDYFCISVAGYPEGHPNRISKIEAEDVAKLSESEKARLVENEEGVFVCRDEDYKKELAYLKEKVDAGADLILTQMFFDVNCFFQFVEECRAIGITVPILPGIMCVSNYGGFKRMTGFCKTRVPKELMERVEANKDDADAMKTLGVDLCTEISRKLVESKKVPGLHFYTLNQSASVYKIEDNLGL